MEDDTYIARVYGIMQEGENKGCVRYFVKLAQIYNGSGKTLSS